MSAVSLPVTRPTGRALLVSNPATRPLAVEALSKLGYSCAEADDPYAAMADLCRRPLAYRAVILSLASLYREELPIIRAIKRRFPHAEVWLTHTDGRPAALAEAVRLGADGLIDDEGLHRVALSEPALADPEPMATPAAPTSIESSPGHSENDIDDTSGEPILSADELRALLQEQPSIPPAGGVDD